MNLNKASLPEIPRMLRIDEKYIIWSTKEIPILVVDLPNCDNFEIVHYSFSDKCWYTKKSSKNKNHLIKLAEQRLSEWQVIKNIINNEQIKSSHKPEA